jgi:hypothetical protein
MVINGLTIESTLLTSYRHSRNDFEWESVFEISLVPRLHGDDVWIPDKSTRG